MIDRDELYAKLKATVHSLVDEGELAPSEKVLIEYFLDHREFGVAFAELVAIIANRAHPITRADFDEIAAMGQAMSIDPRNWRELRPLVSD